MLRYLVLKIDNTSTTRKALVSIITDKNEAEWYCKMLNETETNLAVDYKIEAVHAL